MKVISTILALFFSAAVSASMPLSKLIVFGDSLSDNGNLYEFMKHQLPVSPPYYDGRFTNGPAWVEVLIKDYYPNDSQNHILDYAFGGAGIMDDDPDDSFFTLRSEINSYLLTHNDKADPNAMFVVWIGSNNYLAIPEPSEVEQVLKDVNLGILNGLQRLVDKGAKHILVVTVPDLGNIPIAREFDAVEELSYLSKQHNTVLKQNVLDLQTKYPEIQWLFFDVNIIFDDMRLFPERYGFTNVTDTCYEQAAGNSSQRKSVLKMVSTIKANKRLGNNACDGYLFFDPVHPSAPAHVLMARKTKELFDSNGVVFE